MGDEAKAYNDKKAAGGMSVFVVTDVADEKVANILDEKFNMSTTMPDILKVIIITVLLLVLLMNISWQVIIVQQWYMTCWIKVGQMLWKGQGYNKQVIWEHGLLFLLSTDLFFQYQCRII